MAEIINGVPIGDLPGIESVPDDSMLVVEFLGKAYHMPGAVLRQMIQDVLDSMGDSVDDVTEARLTAAIETVLASGKYNGVSPSVEVLDEEDGTSVIHVIDAFGDKRYPVEVKGATDAVRYKPQSLTDAQKAQARANIGALSAADISDKDNEVVIVKISGSFDAGYTVLLGGLPAPAKGLDVLVENGSIVIGVADGDLTFNFLDDTDYNDPYTVPAGTVFSYRNSTFWVSHIVDQIGEIINMTFALESLGDTWYGNVYPEQYTIYLTGDQPGRIVEFFGRKLEPREAYEILLDAANNDIPLLCYQKDAVFKLEDGSTHTPQYGTPFYYDHNTELLHCEHDGYVCTLYVDLDVYKATAEKNTPYKTAESKADDLKAEDGTLFLLSAGEPIGAGVPLPTGSADDCKIFIADLNTSTYEDIKAADDAGKICYALWGGYTACMLTTLSPESAIFTTLLDPHLGLYVKFTKGTVGVSDFGLTESHSVLYEPQSLTDAQKAQARENIGALSADDIDVDSIGSNVFVGNYDTVTFTEIKTAHDAGRVCFLDFKGIPFLLLGVDDTEALFVREMNENQDYEVTITADGGKSFKILDKNISDVYVAGLFSAKYAEAKAAYEAGKACFVTYGALLCPLTVLDEEKAEFVGMLTPHIGMKGTLYADGTYNFTYVHSNAVQTVEQSLTEEKKAQARANIGALSTADVDTVLQQAKDSGQFDGEDGYTPVKGKDYFDGYTPVKGKDYFDGANGKTAYAYAQDGGYTGTETEFAAKLASDSEPLVVTLSGNDTDGYTADKTVAEIYAAQNAGRDVYMVGGVVTYQLSYLSSSFAAFSYTMASRNAIEIISVIMMSGVAPTRIHQTIDDSYVKYTAQSLDEEYKLQARTNIGAAAAADIATTKYASTSTSSQSIFKISDFGSWGTGAWYQKGFSMLITSRAGETVWFSLSANDSATTARAFRLMNTYSKIAGVYYSVSENAVYVKANAWCNNVTAHILSNIGGDYVPTVASVSGLASDAVEVDIIEFGPTSSGLAVGDSSTPLLLGGSATRPTYNGTDMALSSDLSSYLPLGGGLMTGPLKFQAASLPGKSLQYICGVDAFASGGEMGWQSKADFLSGYLTTTGTAAKATADANGNNIANTYANKNAGNTFNGEQRMVNSSYAPNMNDIASGVGCSLKNARACDNQLIVAEIFAPTTAATDSTINMNAVVGEIGFYHGGSGSGGQFTGKTQLARITSAGIYEGSTLLSNKYLAKSGGTVSGKLTVSGGAYISGRYQGGGDDEGLIIGRASNSYAGLTLGGATGVHATLYLMPDNSTVWRYHNGSAAYDIKHPGKAGTIALTSDLTYAAGGPLIVKISGDDTSGYTADKTYAEIKAAWDAGRNVIAVKNNILIPLASIYVGMYANFVSQTHSISKGVATFSSLQAIIFESGSVQFKSENFYIDGASTD